MSKISKNLSIPVVCSAILCANTSALAVEASTKLETNQFSSVPSLEKNNYQQNLISQVTSVSQFSDVQPTDWAFQALQSLVERYGCIAGYPNGTYRGNRALTRYEFAAGLNACLDRVNELITIATQDGITRQDLATLQRLQEDFAAELATLRGRVDAVEARTSELEANQFSTTSKLQGEVVMVASDVLDGQTDGNRNTTLGARARIEFVTSFTGEDTLLTRIESNNINNPPLNTQEANFLFAGEDGSTNAYIDALLYSFRIGEKTEVVAIANAGASDDFATTVNIFDGDGGTGAFTTFGSRNPIYYKLDGAGLGINHQFSDKIGLSLGYLTPTANDPSNKNGLFNGAYGAMAQLTFTPSNRTTVAFTYINSYNSPLNTGSNAATFNLPAFRNDDGDLNTPVSSNSYGIQASIGLSEKFVLGGWVGYTKSEFLTAGGDADIWNYAVTLGFPDLGKEGNLAGIIVGVEPKVTSSSVAGLSEDEDTSYHIEAFYEYKVSDNISITPGIVWLTAPGHNDDGSDVIIGALRTTFSF